MTLLIKNGHIIDPANKVDGKFDLLIAEGKIAKHGKPGSIPANGAELIDATGKLVVPGFIALHVHLREPGREDKETIATGTRAAAARMAAETVVKASPMPRPAIPQATTATAPLATASRA